MSDYINKDAFVKNITERYCSGCNDHFGVKCEACWVDDMLGEIDSAPTADVVPVVRCKDCLHSAMYCFGNSKTPTLACLDLDEDGNVALATAVRENFFCTAGERNCEVSE